MARDRAADLETLYDAIVQWNATHHYSPSFRELHDETGLPLGHCHLLTKELADAGRIEYSPLTARSIKVVAKRRVRKVKK